MDDFLKNVGSSTESIRMQVNVMGDALASEMEWNEPFFCDCFDKVAKMVTFISRKQKTFTRFQILAHELIKEKKIRCGAAILKSVETRFVSRNGMTERVMLHKKVYKTLVKDESFLVWLRKHPNPIRKEVHTVVRTP
jgi:hypothetical protein